MLDIEQFADSGELFDNHYKLIRSLNTDGGTADVWLALDAKTVKNKKDLDEAAYLEDAYLSTIGLLVAIKIYRPKNALDIEGEQKFADEYKIVYNCNHSNLIHPYHFSIFQEVPYLVLPYCKNGSSELLVGNMTGNDNIWKYILDVSSGLAYLHRNTPPIIHQDIKPGNVLIDDNGDYAITDFGISEKYSTDQEDREIDEDRSGTFAYMSPERFNSDFEPSKESDIWAFGATLYELITGKVPFGEDGGSVQPDGKVNLEFPKGISSSIQKLICACLDKDTNKRPTAEYLMKAAREKRFPVKPVPRTLFVVAIVFLMVAGVLAYAYFMSSSKSEPMADDHFLEKRYGEALQWMSTNDVDSLKTGIAKLDSLAEEKYVPALYELSLTYGWFSDARSVNRKNLLGIELGNKKVSQQGDFLPVSDKYNDKAIGYMTKIADLSNPAYMMINMQATYRLGCYYYFLKANKKIAKKYFKAAKKEARKLSNWEFEHSANQMIEMIDNKSISR